MSDLADVRVERDAFTKQLSDVVRQLTFAGIAIIWILRSDPEKTGIVFDNFLYRPLGAFVLAATFDLLHYFWASAVWDNVYRIYNRPKNHGLAIKQKWWWATPYRIFFWVKAVLAILGFLLLISFLATSKNEIRRTSDVARPPVRALAR